MENWRFTKKIDNLFKTTNSFYPDKVNRMAQNYGILDIFLLFKKSKLSYKKKLTIIVKTKLSKTKEVNTKVS